MKTQISRWSHDSKKRRSGIYQQQGRMITDADLNEFVELFKQRVDDALGDLIGSGLPRTGTSPVGLVVDGPQLRRGTLYVDGIRALLESASGTTPFALNQQADFPGAPAWAGGSPKVLYADVWEWSYTALQDAGLLDPGLHGADTCTRTQTLAQVKLCAALADVLDGTKNPKKGDATLTLDIRQASSAADPCDPCAAEVALDGRVGNYLFRLEVHDVQGPAGAPTEITLKWSSENGAEQHSQENVPAEFKRGDWIYEFYNDTTERHLGVHLGGFTPPRGVLKTGWPAVASDVPAKAQYPYVRRWDGYAVLARSGGGTWSVKVVASALQARDKDRVFELLPVGGTPTHGHYTIDTEIVAYLSGLKLTLDLEGRKFVAGDYWLAAVREDAENANRVQQAGEYSETGTAPNIVRHYLPLGVTHHYMVLAQVSATGTVLATADAETRRLSFPPLTNLTADRVGYSPTAKAARWTDIIDDGSAHPLNVQSAIDVLIEKLESSDIGYELFTCTGVSTSVRQLISWPTGPLTVKTVLDTVLCRLDGSKLPYDAVTGTETVKDKLVALDTNKVNRAGDTMTGSLMISTGGLHVGGGSDPGHGNCVIEGNLTVKGTTTTINTTEIRIEDNIITVNAAEAGGATAATAGLEVQRAVTPGTQAQLLWREAESRWTLGVAGQTRQVSVSSSNTTNYALLAENGRIGQLESGTFGDGWGKWAALGTPNLGFPPTNSNYYGLKVQWDSDAVVFGLKDYGADRKDAIIAWGDNANDNLRFLRPNDVDAMIITGLGYVGIGNDQPQALLDVKSPWGDWIFLRQKRATGAGGFHIHNPWGEQGTPQGANDRNRLEIAYTRADGSTAWGQFVLHGPSGNVGIGTAAPSEKLEVNGNIKLSGVIVQQDWQTPTLLNGWVYYGAPYNPPAFFIDKNGIVHLRGLVRTGTMGTSIFTLPAGYRPANRELLVVMTNSNVAGRCDVLADGNVVPLAGSNVWFSLDGISFRAAQTNLVFTVPVVVFDISIPGGGFVVQP